MDLKCVTGASSFSQRTTPKLLALCQLFVHLSVSYKYFIFLKAEIRCEMKM